MRVRRCTIDSSCVIALDHLELVPQLSVLFSVVLVPKAVRDELSKRRATKDRLQRLFDRYGFFQRCDGYEKGTIDFLLAERTREGTQDRGEVEAAVQASEFGATVIVDDPWGRDLAARYDLEYHGTLWVLQRFHELDLLSSAAVRACFVSLHDRGIRLPWNAISEFLAQIGQRCLDNTSVGPA
jgi:predicted nucleic acid-binding protein